MPRRHKHNKQYKRQQTQKQQMAAKQQSPYTLEELRRVMDVNVTQWSHGDPLHARKGQIAFGKGVLVPKWPITEIQPYDPTLPPLYPTLVNGGGKFATLLSTRGKFDDLCLSINGGQVKLWVYKTNLIQCSSVFEAMFNSKNGFQESKEASLDEGDESNEVDIVIECCLDIEIIAFVFHSLSPGRMPHSIVTRWIADILKLTDMYKLDTLTETCSNAIKQLNQNDSWQVMNDLFRTCFRFGLVSNVVTVLEIMCICLQCDSKGSVSINSFVREWSDAEIRLFALAMVNTSSLSKGISDTVAMYKNMQDCRQRNYNFYGDIHNKFELDVTQAISMSQTK